MLLSCVPFVWLEAGTLPTVNIFRDIKPQNLLLDPDSGVLKLCDFGSAKHLGNSYSTQQYLPYHMYGTYIIETGAPGRYPWL